MTVIAALGDSLTTGFYLSALLPTALRIRRRLSANWFDDTTGDIQSIRERCTRYRDVRCISFARASAHVSRVGRQSFLDRILGVHHFEHQVESWLALDEVPDITLIWLGHNELDWASLGDKKGKPSSESVIPELAASFENGYFLQLQRMLSAADDRANGKVIIACGLVNFEYFFNAREEAERLKTSDSSLYPYLERNYDFFVSMRPEYRQGMIDLSLAYNESIFACVQRLSSSSQSVKLLYSSSLHDVDISDVSSLSEYDAWHPSRQGHHALAEGAFTAIEAYLDH